MSILAIGVCSAAPVFTSKAQACQGQSIFPLQSFLAERTTPVRANIVHRRNPPSTLATHRILPSARISRGLACRGQIGLRANSQNSDILFRSPWSINSVAWVVHATLIFRMHEEPPPDLPAEKMSTLWCPNCGREVRDPLVCGDLLGRSICRICGTPLESADELAFVNGQEIYKRKTTETKRRRRGQRVEGPASIAATAGQREMAAFRVLEL